MNDLAIITVCKNDLEGLRRTLATTAELRTREGVYQYVFDGSDDSKRDAVRACARDSGAEYHWRAPEGTAIAYNQALALVDSAWVWYLNSGDEFIEDFGADMLLRIVRNTSASVVTCSILDQDGLATRRSALPFLWPPVMTWLCFPATLMRAEALREAGGFDASYKTSNDGELWFRLLNNRSIPLDIISVPLVRMEKAGLSGNKTAVAAEGLRFLKKHRWTIFKRWVQSGMRYFEAKRKYRRRLRS